MKRLLKSVTYALAALYFLTDAAFIAIAKPISDWLARHILLKRLRAWIRSLRPYPSLALFSVPVILLEPVKPVAAYLAATGQMVSSVVTLIVGELLKLVLVERLFSLTRDKLMKIPSFAWAYTNFRVAKTWLTRTEAWQTIRALSNGARRYLTQLKKSAAVPLRRYRPVPGHEPERGKGRQRQAEHGRAAQGRQSQGGRLIGTHKARPLRRAFMP